VFVGVPVAVGVTVSVGVAVIVDVLVTVAVLVGVLVGPLEVLVAVLVAVFVRVLVAVGVFVRTGMVGVGVFTEGATGNDMSRVQLMTIPIIKIIKDPTMDLLVFALFISGLPGFIGQTLTLEGVFKYQFTV
jgi:hypothetical protein